MGESINKDFTGCPKCNNTFGFVFGKCIECGWNYLTKRYDTIEVTVSDLYSMFGRDSREIAYLINKHDQRKYKNKG